MNGSPSFLFRFSSPAYSFKKLGKSSRNFVNYVMIFSHILSGSILAGAGVGVFWHFFGRISLFNRLLWGFFLLTTSAGSPDWCSAFCG